MTQIITPPQNNDLMLDILIEALQLKNDAALAKVLCVAPPVVSNIRNCKIEIGPTLLVRMHEITGLQIMDLRNLINGNKDFSEIKAIQTGIFSKLSARNTAAPTKSNIQVDKSKLDVGRLLDVIIDMLDLKNDAALSRVMGIDQPTISRIRNRKIPLGAAMIVRLHELTGVSTIDMQFLMEGGSIPLAFLVSHKKCNFTDKKEIFKSNTEFNEEVLDFDPNRLLDAVMSKLKFESDEELSKALGIEDGNLKKIRNRNQSIKAPLLMRIQEIGGLNFRKLRMLMTDRRRR